MSQPLDPGSPTSGEPQNPANPPSTQPGDQPPAGADGQPPMGFPGQPPLQGAAAPAPSTGTKFSIKQLITAVVILAVLRVAGFFAWQNFQKGASLEVGNCLVWSGDDIADLDVTTVDCSDSTQYSEYVGEVIEGTATCTDPGAIPYTLASDDDSADDATTGCLIPQLFADNCYDINEETGELLMGSCDDTPDFSVVSVVDESEGTCGDEEVPVSYILPARTYCVAFPS